MPAPSPYNIAAPSQTIAINQGGVAAGGLYLFIQDQASSPNPVQVYKDNGSGTYVFLQTIHSPTANDLSVSPRAYDDSSGFLVLGTNDQIMLYKVVAGLFALQDTYLPTGGNTLTGGTACEISGSTVVLTGEDNGTLAAVFHYLTVNTGVFVFQQKVFPAPTQTGVFNLGTADFSGTHLVIGTGPFGTHALACYELSGGSFSLVQTLAGVHFCNVLSNGFLFVVTDPLATASLQIFAFSGTWTLSQTLAYPVAAGTLSPGHPYSFISSTLGAAILLFMSVYNTPNSAQFNAAYLNGATWIEYQFNVALTDGFGNVGARSALFIPGNSLNDVVVFLAAGPTGTNIVLGLKGMKVYPKGAV